MASFKKRQKKDGTFVASAAYRRRQNLLRSLRLHRVQLHRQSFIKPVRPGATKRHRQAFAVQAALYPQRRQTYIETHCRALVPSPKRRHRHQIHQPRQTQTRKTIEREIDWAFLY